MKLSLLVVALFLSCNSFANNDSAFVIQSFVDHGPELAESLSEVSKTVIQINKKLNDKARELSRRNTLSAEHISELKLQADNIADWMTITSWKMRLIGLDFQNQFANTSIGDHFHALYAISTGMTSELRALIALKYFEASPNVVAGQIKSIQFALLDTTGELLVSISNLLALQAGLRESDLKKLKLVYGKLRETFNNLSQFLNSETPHRLGDRTVMYVAGTTISHIYANEGPTKFSAKEALAVEKEIAKGLAKRIQDHEMGQFWVRIPRSLKSLSEDCAAYLSNTVESQK